MEGGGEGKLNGMPTITIMIKVHMRIGGSTNSTHPAGSGSPALSY